MAAGEIKKLPDTVALYDAKYVPRPFGLANTGAFCYLNSLLQALLSCSSLVRTALTHREYLQQTRTGAAFYELVATAEERPENARTLSGKLLSALMADVTQRRDADKGRRAFGASQESASEALALLLEMLDPPAKDKNVKFVVSPISHLFLHRYRCVVTCGECKRAVSDTVDVSVQLDLFYMNDAPPTTEAAFAQGLQRTRGTLDYKCPVCNKLVRATRDYVLTMAPEVLVCVFGIYSARPRRYLPDRFSLPRQSGHVVYRYVADVEHVGALGGGHYTARGRRADGALYVFNDEAAPRAVPWLPDAGNENKYIVFYHACEEIAAGGEKPAE